MVGPELGARVGINQQASKSNAVTGLANTAFEQVTNAKIVRYLLDVDCLTFEPETRISKGDNKEPAEMGQRCYQVFTDAISEVVLFWIA